MVLEGSLIAVMGCGTSKNSLGELFSILEFQYLRLLFVIKHSNVVLLFYSAHSSPLHIAGGNTIQVAPAPSPSALRHTSLDSVHVSNNGSGSSKSKIHVRSNSSPASNETSQQLSRPISRISGDPFTSHYITHCVMCYRTTFGW